MRLELDGLQVDYSIQGRGEPVLLFHGWGGTKDSFAPVANFLAEEFLVVSLDLPGFGQSSFPAQAWGVHDYSQFVYQFMQKININASSIIGHSFGGRIAIMLAANHPECVIKLVLVDSAGIRPVLSSSERMQVKLFKSARKLLSMTGSQGPNGKLLGRLANRFGSADYQEAGLNRGTFVKVVNQDLRQFLSLIKSPTLLIWGENDKEVPVSDGRTMESLIPDAGLVVLENAGHFSYLDRFREFCIIVSHFLNSV